MQTPDEFACKPVDGDVITPGDHGANEIKVPLEDKTSMNYFYKLTDRYHLQQHMLT